MADEESRRWERCKFEGYSIMLRSGIVGTVASLVTSSIYPLILMGSVGLFVAVKHCNQVFGKKD